MNGCLPAAVQSGQLTLHRGVGTHRSNLPDLVEFMLGTGVRIGEACAVSWSAEFDAWGREALERRDVDALLDFAHQSPAGRLAHPRTEHFAPLFVTMGAADAAGDLDRERSVIDGFWMGLAKRSVQFG